MTEIRVGIGPDLADQYYQTAENTYSTQGLGGRGATQPEGNISLGSTVFLSRGIEMNLNRGDFPANLKGNLFDSNGDPVFEGLKVPYFQHDPLAGLET